jgi:hypothetical protein
MAQNSRGPLDRLLPRGLQGVSDPLVLCYSGPSAAVFTTMTGPWLCQPLLLQDSLINSHSLRSNNPQEVLALTC